MVIDRSKHNKFVAKPTYTGTTTSTLETSSGVTNIFVTGGGGGGGLSGEQLDKLNSIEYGAQVNQDAYSYLLTSSGDTSITLKARNQMDTAKLTINGVAPITVNLTSKIELPTTSATSTGTNDGTWTFSYKRVETEIPPTEEGGEPTIEVTWPFVMTYTSGTRLLTTDFDTLYLYDGENVAESFAVSNLLIEGTDAGIDSITITKEGLYFDLVILTKTEVVEELSVTTNVCVFAVRVEVESIYNISGGDSYWILDEEHDAIYTKYNVYSMLEVAAYGYGSGGPGGEGGASYVKDLLDVNGGAGVNPTLDDMLLMWDSTLQTWQYVDKNSVGLNETELANYLTLNEYVQKDDVADLIKEQLDKIFRIIYAEDGTTIIAIEAMYDFYSVGEVTAYGYGQSSGGGVGALTDLSDVSITNLLIGDILYYNGSKWINYPGSNIGSLDPDSIKGGTNIEVVVNGETVTINNTYVLPVADNDVLGGIKISATNDATLGFPIFEVEIDGTLDIADTLKERILFLLELWDMFEWDKSASETDSSLWLIKAKRGMYSVGEVSAYGKGDSELEGAVFLSDLKDVDLSDLENASILLYNSGTGKWVATDGSNLRPDLTGYATETWVTDYVGSVVGPINTTVNGILLSITTMQDDITQLKTDVSQLRTEVDLLNDMFEWDNGKIKAKATLYSVGEISAYGIGEEGDNQGVQYLCELKDVNNGNGTNPSSSNMLLMWNGSTWAYIDRNDVGLNTDELQNWLEENNYLTNQNITWDIIRNKPTTLAGYGITDGVNALNITGTGNAFTSANISGHTLTINKAHTFAYANGTNATGTWPINISGNAATASKLDNAITLTLNGSVTGSASIDGSGNVTLTTTYTTSNISALDGRYVNVTGDTMTGDLSVLGDIDSDTVYVTDYVRIGNVYLRYDSTNHALYVEYINSSYEANFYAEGEVSAYGMGDTGSEGLDEEALWAILGSSSSDLIHSSHLTNALSGYATLSWVLNQLDNIDVDLTDYVTTNTTQTITGVKTFSPSSGAPFRVNSNTVVTNLNADLLDGISWDSFKLQRIYTISLSGYSSSNFYPIFFSSTSALRRITIRSLSGIASASYNCNWLDFIMLAGGWDDTGKKMVVLSRWNYSNSEITIGSVGYGDQSGGMAIWVRGGLTYYVHSTEEPQLKVSDYTYRSSGGTETYTVGTNYYGGSNNNVTICWTNNSSGVDDKTVVKFEDLTWTNISTSTVGSSTRLWYLNAGTPTNSSSNVGSSTNPVYLSSGTITRLSSTVGSSSTPVYLNNGVITQCSGILNTGNYSSYLDGRYVNISGDTMTGRLTISMSAVPGISIDSSSSESSIYYYDSSNRNWAAGLGCWSLNDNFVIGKVGNSYWGFKVNSSGDSYAYRNLYANGSNFLVADNPASISSTTPVAIRTRSTNPYLRFVQGGYTWHLQAYNNRLYLGADSSNSPYIQSNGVLSSQVSTGTAPFTVNSTTKVTNLNADLIDGWHMDAYGTATGIIVNTIIGSTGENRKYIKIGTLPTVAQTSNGLSNVVFEIAGAYNFGANGRNYAVVVAGTRGSIEIFYKLMFGMTSLLAVGYVSKSTGVEIWIGCKDYYSGMTSVRIVNSVNFTVEMEERTSGAPSGFVEVTPLIYNSLNGNIQASGEITAYSTSDIRFKLNLVPLRALDKIRNIGVYEYDWTDEAMSLRVRDNRHDYGIIAQELVSILPEAVTDNMFGKGYLGIDYTRLVPFAILAVKEVDDEVTKLKKRVKRLETRLSRYECVDGLIVA